MLEAWGVIGWVNAMLGLQGIQQGLLQGGWRSQAAEGLYCSSGRGFGWWMDILPMVARRPEDVSSRGVVPQFRERIWVVDGCSAHGRYGCA